MANKTCPACGGSGIADYASVPCEWCDGKGYVPVRKKSRFPVGNVYVLLIGGVLLWTIRTVNLLFEHGAVPDQIAGAVILIFFVGMFVDSLKSWGSDLKN